MEIKYVVILFTLMGSAEVFSQCFSSSGNPVGGSMNMGIMKKKALRVIVFGNYQHYSGYFEGHEPSGFLLYSKASSWFSGSIISYGLTDKLTLETENGYFISRTAEYDRSLINLPEYTIHSTGFANGTLSIKTAIIKNDEKRLRWSAGIGVKYPYTREQNSRDGVTLPFDMQPSTHAFGMLAQTMFVKEFPFTAWRVMFSCRFEKNFENRAGYRYGNVLNNSLLVSKHLQLPVKGIEDKWTIIMQLKNEYRSYSYNDGKKITASGNYILFLVPQFNYTITKKLNVSLLCDFPVYRYYNGTQLTINQSCSLVLVKDI